jgi:hypothetical protein
VSKWLVRQNTLVGRDHVRVVEAESGIEAIKVYLEPWVSSGVIEVVRVSAEQVSDRSES